MKKVYQVRGRFAANVALLFAALSVLLLGTALVLVALDKHTLWLSGISLILVCIAGVGQVFIERPREMFARACLAVPVITLMIVSLLELNVNVNQQHTRDMISEQTRALTDKMIKLTTWNAEVRDVSIDDEKNFITLVWLLSACSTNSDLNVNVWTDGSYHFYWYQEKKLIATDYFKRSDASRALAYIACGDIDEFRKWWSEECPILDEDSNPWGFNVKYQEGSYVATLSRDILDIFMSLDVAIAFRPDLETRTVRFYLSQEDLKSSAYDGEDAYGKYFLMLESEVLGFGGCDSVKFCDNVLRWLDRHGRLASFREPRTFVARTWISNGTMMTLKQERLR